MIISVNDDFSILVAGLEKAGKKYFIKRNSKGQRALFVEQENISLSSQERDGVRL